VFFLIFSITLSLNATSFARKFPLDLPQNCPKNAAQPLDQIAGIEKPAQWRANPNRLQQL